MTCSVQFSCSVMSNSLQPHELQDIRLPYPSPTTGPCSNPCPSRQVMPSNHLIVCHPLILLPSTFPSMRVFSKESVLCIRWPKYWSFSFSISPSNEYSGLISCRMDWLVWLQSNGLSRVFSNTTVQKHPFFGAQISLWSKFPRWRTQEPVWNSVITLQVLSSHHPPYQMPMLSTSLSIHI